MKIRIVSDSASNIYELEGADYVSVPMRVIAGDNVYVDTPALNVRSMMEELASFRGKSNTGHPSIKEWLASFGDADVVFGITVTSKLSGSYNAAVVAADEYMETYPDRQVFILDSKSTGPHMELMLEKYVELINEGKNFKEVKAFIQRYLRKTRCWWSFESLQNFVNTGRINAAVAMIIKAFGICIVGTTNDGELDPRFRSVGTARAMKQIYSSMVKDGYMGGKVRIRHSYGKEASDILEKLISNDYPEADIKSGLNRGLCGYYVEKGGLVVAFETENSL